MWSIHPQRRGGDAGRELADLDAVALIDLKTTNWTATVNCVAVALEARRLVEQMARCVKFAGSARLLTTPTGSRSSDDAAVRELRIAEAYACSHTNDSDHLA